MTKSLVPPDLCRSKSGILLALMLVLTAGARGQTTPAETNHAGGSTQQGTNGPAGGLAPAANNNIAIPRGLLGREFLISASIIPQILSPTSIGLAGKIVRFELFHDGVDLYEATQGLVVTDDLPARRLLTTFPIVQEDEARVVIDFNKGMRRVFTDIWYSNGDFDGADRERTLEVPQSRVFEVTQEGDQLVVRQSAQARDRLWDPNREERYEIRYFIGPYQPHDFKSKEISVSESRHVGFFEVQTQVEPVTGRATSKIARFDVSKPILFYYSANTPADYVDPVKEGILYWNRAFGKEVLKVEKAPPGITAPDIRYNIIQWVPWDNAGMAYADLLVDPRTGESEHGQAYITSVFAIGGIARARELLRLMRADGLAEEKQEATGLPSNPGALPRRLSTNFLPARSLCQVDARLFSEQMAAGLESMLAEGKLDDKAVLRLGQDYVREVVAHEVGHILGLEHNFAASLAGNLSPKEADEWFHQFVTETDTNKMKGRLTSSSVMDYNTFKSRVFIGNLMQKSTEALPYDRAAIQWGYYDNPDVKDKKLLFAHPGQYADVRTFDYGSEPVVGAYAEIADQIKHLPAGIIETFIRAKAPRDPRDRLPLAEVNLHVGSYAARITNELSNILIWFNSATRSAKVENEFDFVGELDRKEIIQAHWKALNDQVEKVGGMDRLTFSFLPVDLKLELKPAPKEIVPAEKIDAKALTERLAKLLESPAYTNFVGLDEKHYTFTKEEKELISKRGKRFFEEFEKELVKRVCRLLEHAPRDIGFQATKMVGDEDIVAELEKRIIDFSKLVITAKNDEEHRKGKVDKSLVEVVDFKYDVDTRLAAAQALADNIGSFKGWSTDAKGDLNKQLKDDVESALNIQNFKDFQESSLSRPLRDWYMDQQAILALLPPKKSK